VNNERWYLSPSDPPQETVAWLKERGYLCLVITPFIGTGPGVVFSKSNGATKLARVGDTLSYDGKTVKVES
jgi:hypothetical protein